MSSAAQEAEQQRLNSIFKACGKGRSIITSEERDAIMAVGGRRADRYGEITPRGFSTLAKRVSLNRDDVFADCGSGVGACVVQSVTEFDVRAAAGVEFARSRHNVAVDELALQPERVASRITLACGDAADSRAWSAGGALCDATVVWACSELFGEDLMRRLAACIAGSENVRCVATLRTFPEGTLRGFREDAPPERCEMSWTAATSNPAAIGIDDERSGAPVHIYVRAGSSGGAGDDL